MNRTQCLVSVGVPVMNGGATIRLAVESMSVKNIDTRPFFNPLSALPPFGSSEFARVGREQNENSYSISLFGLKLPSSLSIDEEAVDYVCREFLAVLDRG